MVWALGALASSPSALAQSAYTLSPLGTRGAINSPTADVLPWGDAAVALVNSNPETKNNRPGVGEFGSLVGGFGFLPGLEGVARLAYAGDSRCNQFVSGCQSGMRDLSVSGKYQLPFSLPLQTRLALGFTDYGGAATHFRSRYAVATSTLGDVDLSLGYSQREASQNLRSGAFDGAFGSVIWQASAQWQAQLEYDTRETRAGVSYALPLSERSTLVAAFSRKLGANSDQEASQLGLTLNIALDKKAAASPVQAHALHQAAPSLVSALVQPDVPIAADEPAPVQATPENPGKAPIGPSPGEPLNSMPGQVAAQQAADLHTALERAGFVVWAMQGMPLAAPGQQLRSLALEPRSWRKNRLDALGHALGAWLDSADPATHLLLALTYQGQPVLKVVTTRTCATLFRQGMDDCAGQPALALFSGDAQPAALVQALHNAQAHAEYPPQDAPSWRSPTLAPQLELGLGLRTAVGTEAGLVDYSSALEIGGELTLAKGLGLQAYGTVPLGNSREYAPGGVFEESAYAKNTLQQALLTYWQPLGLPLPGWSAAQVAAGRVNGGDDGGQLDLLWLSPQGRWRAQWQAGAYESAAYVAQRRPVWGALRYSVLPGHWQLELAAGQFYNLDQGWRISSFHRMGDATVNLYLRETGRPAVEGLPIVRFAGFRIYYPLGPARSTDIGLLAVRGADNWNWGIETKVGAKVNYITPGYGLTSALRHGLTSDVSDYDRGGVDDLWAGRARVREGMR